VDDRENEYAAPPEVRGVALYFEASDKLAEAEFLTRLRAKVPQTDEERVDANTTVIADLLWADIIQKQLITLLDATEKTELRRKYPVDLHDYDKLMDRQETLTQAMMDADWFRQADEWSRAIHPTQDLKPGRHARPPEIQYPGKIPADKRYDG
jgi:hypothetical protein